MHITKQTDRCRDQTSSYQKGEEREEGQDRCIGLRHMNYHVQITSSKAVRAQANIAIIPWLIYMEYNLWKCGITILHTWSYYHIVTQLYIDLKNTRQNLKQGAINVDSSEPLSEGPWVDIIGKMAKDLLHGTGNTARCYAAAWMAGNLGENGSMCMYAWVPSLATWNYHNIVNRLHPNEKLRVYIILKK